MVQRSTPTARLSLGAAGRRLPDKVAVVAGPGRSPPGTVGWPGNLIEHVGALTISGTSGWRNVTAPWSASAGVPHCLSTTPDGTGCPQYAQTAGRQDEYEVARLYTEGDPAVRRAVCRRNTDACAVWHPLLLARPDPGRTSGTRPPLATAVVFAFRWLND